MNTTNTKQSFFNKYKKLIIYILIPLLAGGIGYLLGGGNKIYSEIQKPPFAPPSFLFPIVWSILFVLMGISSYIISKKDNNESALKIYYTQLILNTLWSLLFFRFKLFLLSTVWIAVLTVVVIYMIYLFYNLNRTAGLLQIPYALWLTFAFILNISIYLLNG